MVSADELYNSFYDAVNDLFEEYVYLAPVDYYVSEVSDDLLTYYYAFVDADGCYSYSGEVYNSDDNLKVYLDDNGH